MVIRKILFDAFGTIFSPRKPVHIQYAEVARSLGLQIPDDSIVQKSFLIAFKKLSKLHPLYGKLTGLNRPEEWWNLVIFQTFLEAGISIDQLKPVSKELTQTLIKRFHSRLGYSIHPSIFPTLSYLHFRQQSLSPNHQIQNEILGPGIVSGSDRGALLVLNDLGVLRSTTESESESEALASNSTCIRISEISGSIQATGEEQLDWRIKEKNVYTTWDIELDKKDPLFWDSILKKVNEEARELGMRRVVEKEEILMVGDELIPDYLIPKKTGFQALLLRRPELNVVSTEEGLEGVETIGELNEIIDWLKRNDERCRLGLKVCFI